MPTLHVLRVFVDEAGRGGNPLGVFLEGAEVADSRRQGVAAELGFSETVFVDDAGAGVVRIFTPSTELTMAGHPLVGTAWLLTRAGYGEVGVMRPPAGEVPTWEEGPTRYIRARPEWAPDFELRRLSSPREVDEHPPAVGSELLDLWAFEDEASGLVRSRVFAGALGVPEDEATGAAALRLGAHLGRPVRIRQGAGSVILARPGPDGTVEVGGGCALDEIRDHGA